LLRYCFL